MMSRSIDWTHTVQSSLLASSFAELLSRDFYQEAEDGSFVSTWNIVKQLYMNHACTRLKASHAGLP